jgi:hypothetical protein
MSRGKSPQCNLNCISTLGVTARVEASFVLRILDSISLPDPKCGKAEKGKPSSNSNKDAHEIIDGG